MIGVTWASLLSRYRNRLSETSPKFFDDAQALSFANEAQDAISTKVPYTVIASWGLTTIPYRAEYLLNDDLIHPTGAFLRRSGGQLVRMNLIEKDLMDGAKSWGAGSRVPTEALELYVEGHKRPKQLTTDTDTTDIPANITGVILDYMEAAAKSADEENAEHELAMRRYRDSLEALQISRIHQQYDQHERTRANRRVSQGWSWPYWCAYRQTEEGISVEIWGV